MMFSLAMEEVKNPASAWRRCMRKLRSPVFSMRAMFSTKGRYIGTSLPIAGASKLKMQSSTVTGDPSWNFMPVRSVKSMVVGSTCVTVSAAQGRGKPSGPMRMRRSHTSSVTQESVAPLIHSGWIACTGSDAFSTMSLRLPSGSTPR